MVTARVRIGERLVREGIIDQQQLAKAVEEQKRTGALMGQVLVKMGMVKDELLQSYLERQAKARDSRRLGEALVEDGMVSAEQLEAALDMSRRTGQKLGTVLVKKGFLSEHNLLDLLSARLSIPAAHLGDMELSPSLSKILTEDMCRQYKVLPLGVESSKLRLAMTDPTDLKTIDIVRYKTTMDVQPHLAIEKELLEGIDRIFHLKDPLSRSTRDQLVSAIERMLEAQKALCEMQEKVMQQQRLVMSSVQEMLYVAKTRAKPY